jgi:hypothetical protein
MRWNKTRPSFSRLGAHTIPLDQLPMPMTWKIMLAILMVCLLASMVIAVVRLI